MMYVLKSNLSKANSMYAFETSLDIKSLTGKVNLELVIVVEVINFENS